MKILIADDDPTSRLMLSRVLQKMGHEVAETKGGDEAWKRLLQDDAPRLAIIDWVMPDMDGVELIRKLRAQPIAHPLYLIMLTSRTGKTDIVAGLDAGANDYLIKPFDPEEMRARISVGLRMVETQEALAAKIEELGTALEHIRTLRGIVPICGHCKKIRDDSGFWQQVEEYVRDHTEAEFSHSLCPGCMKKLYPEFSDD